MIMDIILCPSFYQLFSIFTYILLSSLIFFSSSSQFQNNDFSGYINKIGTNSIGNNFTECSQPRFIKSVNHLTALASFPGSGNTWLRYLVQQASGFLTGSIYKDYFLLRKGFPAESVFNESVILIKTHEWGEITRKQYDKAILLVRNPFRTLLAEYNRRSGGHLGYAPIKRYQEKEWKHFVLTQSKTWSQFILDWLKFNGELLLVRYEKLVSNLKYELKRILSFLGADCSFDRLNCIIKQNITFFKRNERILPFDPFSIQIINVSLRKLVQLESKKVYKAIEIFELNHKLKLSNCSLKQ